MALRQAIKISRALLPHKHKLQRSVCPLYTKPSKLFQLNSFSFKKASSYSDNVAPKVKKVTKETSDDVKEPEVLEQNVAFESWLEPVEEKTVKKEFVKSSTQNALTMPLKIPRLANPFPEPVICQRSHTVSDAEKARIMLEEVKMETKYGLLHQQQTLKRQNWKPTNYSQQAESPSTQSDIIQKDSRRSQHCDQNSKHHQNDLGRQPNYRRAKNYEELQDEKQSCSQIQYESSQKSHQETTAEQNRNDTELNDEQIKKGRRKLTKSRAPRYLKNFWKQKDQQTRKYSTSSKYFQNEPDAMSQVEQCEKILERIKAMYPESYGHLRKPFCLPGSPEEQEFIKNIFLLSRRTNERNQIEEVYRPSAPVPSYSEVKTLVRKPKTPLESIYNLSNRNSEDVSRNYSTRIETSNDRYNFLERNKLSESFDSEIMSNRDNIHDIQERKNDEYRMPTPYRSYSECVDSAEDLEEEVMECEENTRETHHEEDKTHNRKRDLLFDKRRGKDDIKNRSYSTYTTRNQVQVHDNFLKQKYSTLFKQRPRNRKNNYCTNMDVLNNKYVKPNQLGSYKDNNEEIEFIKKKAPCENPYSDLPICDYEKARKIRDDKRNNRRNNTTKKKKCSATGKESDVESLESSSEVSKEKTKNVIKRIRNWLSSWRPESENIRVSKFYTDIEGRDTYIIQIDEYEEQERQRKETMELKHEEKMKSYTVPYFMEKEIITKKCEPVQQPDKIEQKPIVKENKLERRISPTAIINKINKLTKKKQSESFRINDREFIPEPIKNSYNVNTDFNNQIKVLVEPVDSPLYLEKNKKKNPCSQKKKEPKKKKCRQEIKKKLPSCNDVKEEKLYDRSESIPPLATKNSKSRTKQLLKKFSFTHSNSKKEGNIEMKPQEIGHINHEITQNNIKNRDAPFKLKQEFWK